SNDNAALNPLVILVSINTKKTGPIIKLRKKPKDAPVKISSILIGNFRLADSDKYRLASYYNLSGMEKGKLKMLKLLLFLHFSYQSKIQMFLDQIGVFDFYHNFIAQLISVA